MAETKLVPTQFKLSPDDRESLSWLATVMGEDSGGTLPIGSSEVVRRLIRQEVERRERKSKKVARPN